METKHNVVVVDDSPDDCFFLRRLLEANSKLTVSKEINNGQEAIEFLKQNQLPRVLFLDLKMPGKNGFDVLDWILKNKLHQMIIVVMSGSCLPDDISKSLSLGATAYFRKSADKPEQKKMIADLELLLEKL